MLLSPNAVVHGEPIPLLNEPSPLLNGKDAPLGHGAFESPKSQGCKFVLNATNLPSLSGIWALWMALILLASHLSGTNPPKI